MADLTPFREALERAHLSAWRLRGPKVEVAEIAADYPIEDTARESHAALERALCRCGRCELGMSWLPQARRALAKARKESE